MQTLLRIYLIRNTEKIVARSKIIVIAADYSALSLATPFLSTTLKGDLMRAAVNMAVMLRSIRPLQWTPCVFFEDGAEFLTEYCIFTNFPAQKCGRT